ncbi:MAG: two pore domain potassium channel family protein [Rhodothermaceae bacterium]|nr:two pore domain potassium channel family protein [Rhodothermaceae bacterium]
MPFVYPVLGSLVLLTVVVDIVWSTLSAAGGGPLSRRLGRLVWVASGRFAGAGPLVLVATAVLWIGLLWAGWTLIFLAAPEAAVAASSGEPADFWSRVYYAGYTVITLGLGDYVPSTPLWQQLAVLSAAAGLVFITLGVTYYTAVLSAAVQMQQLAAMVRALGDSPGAIVAGAWDGDGFNGMASVLTTLASHFALHARRHLAYPVLHYFRESDPQDAFAVQAARLGEALYLLDHAVAAEHRPPSGPLRLACGSLQDFLRTLHGSFVEPAEEAPPTPDLAPLHAAGVPLASEVRLDAVRDERRLLLALVRDSRYRWADVSGAN